MDFWIWMFCGNACLLVAMLALKQWGLAFAAIIAMLIFFALNQGSL